jgi:hypothetical protein
MILETFEFLKLKRKNENKFFLRKKNNKLFEKKNSNRKNITLVGHEPVFRSARENVYSIERWSLL